MHHVLYEVADSLVKVCRDMDDTYLNLKTGLAAGHKLACRVITRIVNIHVACNEDKPALPRNAWQKQGQI